MPPKDGAFLARRMARGRSHSRRHSTGWMCDARRKLAYVFTFRGEAWAMRVNPATAKLVEKPEE